MNKASSGLMAMNQGRDNRHNPNFNRASLGSGIANVSHDDSEFGPDYDAGAKI